MLQFKLYLPSFNLVLVICSFFDLTGWAIKNDERIALVELLLPLYKSWPKNLFVDTYHKILYSGFLWFFGHTYSLIFYMYSYTFIFKIFGFIQVFLLVSKKKIYIYIKATVVFGIDFTWWRFTSHVTTSWDKLLLLFTTMNNHNLFYEILLFTCFHCTPACPYFRCSLLVKF